MKLAVIGIGNMGQALIGGFISKNAQKAEEIYLYDTFTSKAKEVASKYGCIYCEDIKEAVGKSDLVLFAVKPQIIEEVIDDIKDVLNDKKILISIAAGVTLSDLREYTKNKNIPLVRVMPNTPAIVGQGASAISYNGVNESDKEYINNLFGTCGLVIEINEDKMDAVTGLSGSGPAYVMIFIEALADAGVKMGLSRQDALNLAAATVKGSAQMVLETGIHPAQLKDNVCSPGGTTIEAVHALEKGGFRASVIDAVCASANKSKELSLKPKENK